MKQAVAHCAVHRGGEGGVGAAARAQGKVVIATVKGDVHDIGKNIVSVRAPMQQLRRRQSRVMVPAEKSCRQRAMRTRT